MQRKYTPIPELSPQDIENFWSHVTCGLSPDDCWIFSNGLSRGYGHIVIQGRRLKAHRISYAIAHGAIPDGMDILHRCDNPPCVNPLHLFAGTHTDNIEDMLSKGRDGCLRSKKVLFYGDNHWSHKHPEKTSRGEKNGGSKLTEGQIAEIRASSLPSRALGRMYGVSHTQIRRIRQGNSWKHL